MIFTTKGIVVRKLNYGDTSIIVTIYTEKFGMQTYMVKGTKGKKSSKRSNLFFPFALLELEVYHRENKEIQSLKEAHIVQPLNQILFDISKNIISQFLAEVLSKTIREEEKNEALFRFLYHHVSYLELMTAKETLFPLFFLCKLTRFLGFFPQLNYNSERKYFDLDEGEFIETKHHHSLLEDVSKHLFLFFKSSLEDISKIELSIAENTAALNGILNFYAMQVQDFKKLKTLSLMQELIY